MTTFCAEADKLHLYCEGNSASIYALGDEVLCDPNAETVARLVIKDHALACLCWSPGLYENRVVGNVRFRLCQADNMFEIDWLNDNPPQVFLELQDVWNRCVKMRTFW